MPARLADMAKVIEPGQPRSRGLVRVDVASMLRVFAGVVLPVIAKGALIRRPTMVTLAARFALDARAVRILQHLRRTYGDGPLLLPFPGRRQAILLAPEHVHRVLIDEPELFTSSTWEKRAALAHFEPRTSLISSPPEREPRRRFHDEVLESGRPAHSLGGTVATVAGEEVETLLARAGTTLRWGDFTHAWHRTMRRIILGDAAADDDELTDMLARLRAAGNWAFLHPQRRRLRQRFRERLVNHLARAAPASLAAGIARRCDAADPIDQVTQWLFATDAAGIATYRALALIATAPGALASARGEDRGVDAAAQADERPFTRACLLEALRLWPTTPAILRETTAPSEWEGGTMPAGTLVLVFLPFFHRDGERLPQAHRFVPELWQTPRDERDWPLIPFSEGPAGCPGRNLMLLAASATIAALLHRRSLALDQATLLDANRPLTGTLDHFRLSFTVERRVACR